MTSPKLDRAAVTTRKIDPSTVTADLLRELLDYNPETGEVIWKPRSPDRFNGNRKESQAMTWNKLFAGKPAGSVSSAGYAVIIIGYRQFTLGRILWTHFYGSAPNGEIDHIDGDPLNNAIANLREANRAQNAANRRLQSNNKSGFKGVHSNNGMWTATISVDGKATHLGTYLTPEEAHAAWQGASRLAFGEFHRSA